MAFRALGQSLFRRDCAMGQRAWSVTSVLLFSPPFTCLFTGRSSDWFRAQLTVVLHSGSLVSFHNLPSLCSCFNNWSRQGKSLFMSESVTLLIASWSNRGCRVARRFIGFYPRVYFDSGWYKFRGEALKPIPICEFFNRFQKITNFDMIQYVEYYW
jgi:hypothetical protein